MSGLGLIMVVGLAGGLGAVLRFVIDSAVQRRIRSRFAWGTMIINLTGSFLLGAVTVALATTAPPWGLVAGTGLLGGYTTFSAASVETVRLVRDRRWSAALLNGPGMLVLAVGAAALGGILGAAVLAAVG